MLTQFCGTPSVPKLWSLPYQMSSSGAPVSAVVNVRSSEVETRPPPSTASIWRW